MLLPGLFRNPCTISQMHDTRQHILNHLKREPAASIEQLAGNLGLAPMTIRQHLSKLAADGLVDVATERRPTGRPAHVYNLTPAGEERFPKAYARLTDLMLEEMASLDAAAAASWSTPSGRSGAFRAIAARAAETHLAALEPLAPPERAEAAVAILREESGFTELQHTSGGLEVREYNCVFQRVAEGHEEICTFHTEYVSKLMGTPVVLEACQCDGANACRFLVQGS